MPRQVRNRQNRKTRRWAHPGNIDRGSENVTVTSLQTKTPLWRKAERPILRPGEPIKGPALPGQNQAEKSTLVELVAVVLALQLGKARSARARSGARGSKKRSEISHCYPGALWRPATFRKGPDTGPEKRPGQHPLNRAQRVRFAATLPAQAGRCGVLTFACWTARFGQQRGGVSVTVTGSAWPTGWARSRKRAPSHPGGHGPARPLETVRSGVPCDTSCQFQNDNGEGNPRRCWDSRPTVSSNADSPL